MSDGWNKFITTKYLIYLNNSSLNPIFRNLIFQDFLNIFYGLSLNMNRHYFNFYHSILKEKSSSFQALFQSMLLKDFFHHNFLSHLLMYLPIIL